LDNDEGAADGAAVEQAGTEVGVEWFFLADGFDVEPGIAVERKAVDGRVPDIVRGKGGAAGDVSPGIEAD
jgi:hypothetical protein